MPLSKLVYKVPPCSTFFFIHRDRDILKYGLVIKEPADLERKASLLE